jgi:hypothetical protein
MRVEKLSNMTKGWFIGNFDPSILKTNECEIGIKSYVAGDYEKKHYHKVATEYTVVVKGKVRMFDQEFEEGDIIITEPYEATDFTALTDVMNVVVKIPGVNNDKYDVEG